MPSGIYQRKYPAWNKGLKGYYHIGSFQKGHPDFTNGSNAGKNNWQWKGENASYSPKHKWIVKYYGNPSMCEDCGKKGKKEKRIWNIDWSNNSGNYMRDKKDWTGRCRKCHYKYDRELNGKIVGFNQEDVDN